MLFISSLQLFSPEEESKLRHEVFGFLPSARRRSPGWRQKQLEKFWCLPSMILILSCYKRLQLLRCNFLPCKKSYVRVMKQLSAALFRLTLLTITWTTASTLCSLPGCFGWIISFLRQFLSDCCSCLFRNKDRPEISCECFTETTVCVDCLPSAMRQLTRPLSLLTVVQDISNFVRKCDAYSPLCFVPGGAYHLDPVKPPYVYRLVTSARTRIFDPNAHWWYEGPSLLTGRVKHHTLTVGSKLYVLGKNFVFLACGQNHTRLSR